MLQLNRSFQDAKDKREMDKDPIHRLENFSKQATKGNTQVSGSFGGKPKLNRAKTNKKSVVPPAWFLGEEGVNR